MRAEHGHQLVFLLVIAMTSAMTACGGSASTQTTAPPASTTPPGSAPPSTPAPAVHLSASPASITAGQSSVLSWTTTNATSVTIQPGGLSLAASGSITVTPSSSTTYTATATGAGGSATSSIAVTVTSAPPPPPPPAPGFAFGHVVIVALENKNYSTVVGNTSAMPYLNSLISSYGLGTNYYANTHPSIGNYFMLTTGQIITNDDGFSGVVTADNVVRRLNSAGKSWRSYAEDLPSAGYLGGDTGLYVRRHNPFTFFSDVQNDAAMAKADIVPFAQFGSDLGAGKLPQYSFVVPNIDHDAHECPNGIDACEAVADQWLQANIGALLADPAFRADGVLIVWFDESDSDNSNGGGKVPIVFVSPAWSKPGYRSSTFGQHENTLRFTMDALGISSVPGAGSGAHGWNEFFIAH
ncbi:MAG TPA: alkaline phosphatase family protein [Terriglobales bacterium]|nr:alkaline phosphatase family protein [Terriglobales bacterium]